MANTPWNYDPTTNDLTAASDETICEDCHYAYYVGLPVCSTCHGDRYSLIVPEVVA